MAQISIEELYCGEGGGAKYGVGGIMGAVMQEIMLHGVPKEYDERTYIELLIVKHTLKAAEQMKTEGDFVSGITDAEPPSCYAKAVESFIAEQLLSDDVTNSALTDKLARAVHALSEDNAKAISKGLFRYAVQLEILMRMFAQVSEFSDDELKDMRREAVNNVRRTRGKIPLEEIMRGYYNEE